MQQPDQEKVDPSGLTVTESNSVTDTQEGDLSEYSAKHKLERPSSPALSVTSSTSSTSSKSSVTPQIRYDINKVYASGVSTFFSLMGGHKTLAEFSYDPSKINNKKKSMYKAARFIALEIIALWTPREAADIHNFTMHYIYYPYKDSITISPRYHHVQAANYTKFSTKIMRDNFVGGKPSHLGSLLFLNYILDGSLTDNNLGIASSFFSNYYFVQRCEESRFFTKFLQGKDTTLSELHLTSFLTSTKHTEWWDAVIPENMRDAEDTEDYLRGLFLHELFETVLRVYLTPDRVIELIVSKLSDPKFTYNEIIKYILDIKRSVLSSFVDNLTEDESAAWNKFFKERSFQVYEIYKQDLHICLSNFDIPQHAEYYTHAMLDLLVNADNRRVPDLIASLGVNRSRSNVGTKQKADKVSYLFELICRDWHKYSRFSDYVVWGHLDQLCAGLHTEMTAADLIFQDDEGEHIQLQAVLMVACNFKFNHICRFLLLQYPSLAKSLVIKSDLLMYPYTIYTDTPLVIYAVNIGNEIVADYIEKAISNTLSDAEEVKQTKLVAQSSLVFRRVSSVDLSCFDTTDEDAEKPKNTHQVEDEEIGAFLIGESFELGSNNEQEETVKTDRNTTARRGRQRSSSFSGWEELEKLSKQVTKSGIEDEESTHIMSWDQYQSIMDPKNQIGEIVSGKKVPHKHIEARRNQAFFPAIGDDFSKNDSKGQTYEEAEVGTIIRPPPGCYGNK